MWCHTLRRRNRARAVQTGKNFGHVVARASGRIPAASLALFPKSSYALMGNHPRPSVRREIAMTDLEATSRFDDQPGEPFDDQFIESPLDADATPVCPHCIEPINRFDHFCPHCGGPVTAHASIDPLGQVFAAGRAYQNATGANDRQSPPPDKPGRRLLAAPGSGAAADSSRSHASRAASRPRGIVVLGMWLIFAPQILILAAALAFQVADTLNLPGAPTTEFPLNNAVAALASLALLSLYATILWKVTQRWQTQS